jgi:hypothetical protein
LVGVKFEGTFGMSVQLSSAFMRGGEVKGTFGMSVQLSSAFMKHAFTEAVGTFLLLSNQIQNESTVSYLTETSDWFPFLLHEQRRDRGRMAFNCGPSPNGSAAARTGFGAGGNTAHKILEKL